LIFHQVEALLGKLDFVVQRCLLQFSNNTTRDAVCPSIAKNGSPDSDSVPKRRAKPKREPKPGTLASDIILSRRPLQQLYAGLLPQNSNALVLGLE
jgi:hypothetical protein